MAKEYEIVPTIQKKTTIEKGVRIDCLCSVDIFCPTDVFCGGEQGSSDLICLPGTNAVEDGD